MPFNLYFANAESTKLKLEVRYIPLSDVKKTAKGKSEAANLAGIIVKELIKGPGENSGLKTTIPKGTTLRTVSIKNSVATVDLSKEFVDKHPGGEMAARLTLYSVVNSLTELKEIEKVKFTIQGKTISDFKESFQLNAAFPRMTSLISTAVNLPGSGTGDKAKTQEKTTDDKTKKQEPDKTAPAKDTKKIGDTKQQDTKQSDNSIIDQAAGEAVDEDSEGVYLDTLEEDTLE
jgi:germination protein M